MKKCLVVRYGAFGDIIHLTHLPRLLKKRAGFDIVDVETNAKGLQILAENPYIDTLTTFEPSLYPDLPYGSLQRRWAVIGEGYDKVINLTGTIEEKLIAMENQNIYYQGTDVRRKAFGGVNYYDAMTMEAGLGEEYFGTTGEMYFKQSEIDAAAEFLSPYQDRFIVMMNLSGSSLHKRFMQAEEVANRICAKYPNALIITTGDKTCQAFDFKIQGKKISLINDSATFRGMCILAKFVDLCMGCESGLMVASNMWNTPTVQLLTAANHNNHPKYAKNDFSLQSPAPCAPCHKGPYKYRGCTLDEAGYPVCVHFDVNLIMEQVEKAHQVYLRGHEIDRYTLPITTAHVASLSALRG